MIHRIISVFAAFSIVFVPSVAHAGTEEDVCQAVPPAVQAALVKYGWNC